MMFLQKSVLSDASGSKVSFGIAFLILARIGSLCCLNGFSKTHALEVTGA
jgi:hypothetical protein